jgi:hypothetical protein
MGRSGWRGKISGRQGALSFSTSAMVGAGCTYPAGGAARTHGHGNALPGGCSVGARSIWPMSPWWTVAM